MYVEPHGPLPDAWTVDAVAGCDDEKRFGGLWTNIFKTCHELERGCLPVSNESVDSVYLIRLSCICIVL